MIQRYPPDLPDIDEIELDDDEPMNLEELADLATDTDELPILRLVDADDIAETDG